MSTAAYLRSGKAEWAVMAGVLTVVACFQRYAGLSLVITGSLDWAYANRSKPGGRACVRPGLCGRHGSTHFRVGFSAQCSGQRNRVWRAASGGAQPQLRHRRREDPVLVCPFPDHFVCGPVCYLRAASCLFACWRFATGGSGFFERLRQPHVRAEYRLPAGLSCGAHLRHQLLRIEGHQHRPGAHHCAALLVGPVVLQSASRWWRRPRRKSAAVWCMGSRSCCSLVWTSYPISKAGEYVTHSMVARRRQLLQFDQQGKHQRSALAQYLRGLDLHEKQGLQQRLRHHLVHVANPGRCPYCPGDPQTTG